MGDIEVKGGLNPIKVTIKTGQITEIIVTNSIINILEMEDVLFHHNSAVMMPGRPQGASSADGTEDDANNPHDQNIQKQQEEASGIDALALVFKESEYHPEQRILIAAHTDTSGDYETNYMLSEQRAKNVLYLLLGRNPMASESSEDGVAWAEICASRHKIEDYQQILLHFVKRGDLPPSCNPRMVTDSWNRDTENACNAFFDISISDHTKAAEIKQQVRSDSKHRWPIDVWKSVYKLYLSQLLRTLNVTPEQLTKKREALVTKFSPPNFYVACGESYPIENSQKDNYRSQKNRRVEILFLDKDALKDIKCPEVKNRKHRTHLDPPPIECPIWHNFIERKYIDPKDLYYTEKYFIQFKYFNRILNRIENVPKGLTIEAFKNDNTKLLSETSYTNGTYCVAIRFPKSEYPPLQNDWYLKFTTDNAWIFTPNANATPQLISRSTSEVLALPIHERMCYYDLPHVWYSRNYWTRYDGSLENGDRWDIVINKIKSLAPAGKERLSEKNPLIFSLDDIVLLDHVKGKGTLTHNVLDANHLAIQPHNPWNADVDEIPSSPSSSNNFLELNMDSRIKILTVNESDGRLRLLRKDPNILSSCRISFPVNLIIDSREEMHRAVIIFFRDGFYTIGHRRTEIEEDWENRNFVVGARAAIRNDTQYHRRWDMSNSNEEFAPWPGDYELHYFHHLYYLNNRPISYVIKYVSISFIRDTRTSTPMGMLNAPPWSPNVTNFIDEGIYLAMNRWNQKPIYFVNRDSTIDSTEIYTMCFFDERETFHISDNSHPSGIEFEDDPRVYNDLGRLWGHSEFIEALKNARGGKSRFLAFICDNERAWCWHIRGHTRFHPPARYSLFKLDDDDWQGPGTESEDGENNQGFFTFAHEIGHAMGLYDEYNSDGTVITQAGNPQIINSFTSYSQGWMPYTMPANQLSMMQGNVFPRMHHMWYILHQLNADIISGAMSMFFPNNRQFIIRDVNRNDLLYDRGIMSLSSGSRVINKSPAMRVPNICRDTVRGNFTRAQEQHVPIPHAPGREVCLGLYDVALDRSSNESFHIGQTSPYQGVLVVRLLMRVSFEGGVNHAFWRIGGNAGGGGNLAITLQKIQNLWDRRSGWYSLSPGTRGMERIFVHFIPGFSIEASPETNMEAFFLRSNTPQGEQPIVFRGGRVHFRFDFTEEDFIKFLFNLPANATIGSNVDEHQYWDFIRIWVSSHIGENLTTFQMQDL